MQKIRNAETLVGVHTRTHMDNLVNKKDINKISTQNKPII